MLNNQASNANRGKALSLYMIVQMAGIVTAQYILTLGDISGYVLFIVPSVLVSMAFAPILLSIRPTPAFSQTKPLSIARLIKASPLACVGMFLLGGVFAAQFGMSAVYGTKAGLTVGQISLFVSSIYVTALIAQYPIGWMSDRMDRRILIIALAALGGVGALIAMVGQAEYWVLLVGAAMVGGTSNPLYALLIAYTNDYLDPEDMPAASGGLLFINGVGAIGGPLIVGFAMDWAGPAGFWAYLAFLMLGLAAYGGWRMTQRRTRTLVGEAVPYAKISASSTAVAAEVAQEVYRQSDAENAVPPATP